MPDGIRAERVETMPACNPSLIEIPRDSQTGYRSALIPHVTRTPDKKMLIINQRMSQ